MFSRTVSISKGIILFGILICFQLAACRNSSRSSIFGGSNSGSEQNAVQSAKTVGMGLFRRGGCVRNKPELLLGILPMAWTSTSPIQNQQKQFAEIRLSNTPPPEEMQCPMVLVMRPLEPNRVSFDCKVWYRNNPTHPLVNCSE